MASTNVETELTAVGADTGPRAPVRILFGGDAMLGRGIDQILPVSNDPAIDESWREIYDARTFVTLAVRKNGPLPESRDASYVWGDVLDQFGTDKADLRIVNLETAVTACGDALRGKDIRYRMHPGNVPTLRAANIDCCVLANNHTLDWGLRGLADTLASLNGAGIRTAGAGRDIRAAESPAFLEPAGKARVAVLGFATGSGLAHPSWAATAARPGLDHIGLTPLSIRRIAGLVRAARTRADIVVASIHWGGNWSYAVPSRMRRFAQRLIEEAGVDVIHGHSAHHVKGIEVYRDRLILYGCGDLIDDYEGVPLHKTTRSPSRAPLHAQFRPELGLLYRATLEPSGALQSLDMIPICIRQMRVNHASEDETRWLEDVLNREGRRFGTRVERENGTLRLRW